MKHRRTTGRLLAAFFTVTAGAAGADPSWGVSAGALQRRLVERADDGRRLVKESGPMLRLALDARWTLAGGGALQAGAGIAAGRLDYDGQTQAGAPLSSDSGHRDLDFTLAWRPLPAASWGEGWLVLRAAQQRRQIASTASARGLRETSTLLMPGLRWAHGFEAGGMRWQPAIELRASVDHRVKVGFGGTFDDADIEGGRRREAVLALQASAPDSPWSWGIEWTHARQSASLRATLYRGGAAVGTVRQPRIAIDDIGLRVRRAF